MFNLNDASATNGWAGLETIGALNLQATVANLCVIKLVSLTSGNTPGLVAGFTNGDSYAWTVATASGGIQNFSPSVFLVDATAFSNALAGAFSVATNGNSLVVNYTPAPVLKSLATYSAGNFGLNFSGPSGQSYRVLACTNLALPLADWVMFKQQLFARARSTLPTAPPRTDKSTRIASP